MPARADGSTVRPVRDDRRVEPKEESRDVTRRTRLANERTYLAWWRSGLTALAVAFAVGKLGPGLVEGAGWPYQVVGIGYAALGLTVLLYGERRRRQVERELLAGRFPPLEGGVALALTASGVALAVATGVLIAL